MKNQSIEILMNEHRLILKSLDAAEAMADRFEEKGEIHGDDLRKFVSFVTDYADEFHHKKEEDVLFKWMEERGFPAQGGPIAMMLFEHDAGRDLVAAVKDGFERWNAGDKGGVTAVAGNLRAFAGHLRQHIFKEDNILYPMALSLFGVAGEDEAVVRRYREKVSEARSAVVNHDYGKIVSELEGIYAR
jgi:hemerythrin-like domain-containing protein